ncbi:MAG: hypothetical protein KAX37_07560 [Opitutaceae bacterium]|nr:hypothetical protein [Opitutaceae bacterium]
MSRGKKRRPDEGASCRGKRRYRSEGEALEAAAMVGVERQRVAYRCPTCFSWHLATARKQGGVARRRSR